MPCANFYFLEQENSKFYFIALYRLATVLVVERVQFATTSSDQQSLQSFDFIVTTLRQLLTSGNPRKKFKRLKIVHKDDQVYQQVWSKMFEQGNVDELNNEGSLQSLFLVCAFPLNLPTHKEIAKCEKAFNNNDKFCNEDEMLFASL